MEYLLRNKKGCEKEGYGSGIVPNKIPMQSETLATGPQDDGSNSKKIKGYYYLKKGFQQVIIEKASEDFRRKGMRHEKTR